MQSSMNLPTIGNVMQVAHGLRFHEVRDDHLAPEVRPRDFVLIAPVDQYDGEGYYLVGDADGGGQLNVCRSAGHQHPRYSVLLHVPNPVWRGQADQAAGSTSTKACLVRWR